jgi:hypothetical protein
MPLSGASLGREIAAVRRSLTALDRALARLATHAKRAGRFAKASVERPTRKLQLTAARRKALQLHGKYLGYVRQLKPRAKAQVRALRLKKGVRAAIAKARKLAAA